MSIEILEMQKLVGELYSKKVLGVEFLKLEDKFYTLKEKLEGQKLNSEDSLEFQCLCFEYEILYRYQRSYNRNGDTELFQSFVDLFERIYSHELIERLVNSIFSIGNDAIIDISSFILPKTIIVKGFIWETIADNYFKNSNYKEAYLYYWKAIDSCCETIQEGEGFCDFLFYDQPIIYVSDLIYRLYKCLESCNSYEKAVEDFNIRKLELSDYTYFWFYYALTIYKVAIEKTGKERKKLMQDAWDCANKVGEENIGLFELKCGVLYELERYTEIKLVCKKAVEKNSIIDELSRTMSFSIFADIHLLYKYIELDKKELVRKVLNDASDYIDSVKMDTMDGYVSYMPIIKLYKKYKDNKDNIVDIIISLIKLLWETNSIKEQLQFKSKEETIGFYTSIASLSHILKDEKNETKYRMSMFDARHMNDPNEGKVIERYLDEGLPVGCVNLEDFTIYGTSCTFLKSFTTKVDSLPMWVQYAENGTGCFVKVNTVMFEKATKELRRKKNFYFRNLPFEEDYQLYSVAYYDGDKFQTNDGSDITENLKRLKLQYQQIRFEWIENNSDKLEKNDFLGTVNHVLSTIKYLIKRKEYDNEDEVRIMLYRNGKESDIEQADMGEGKIPRLYVHLNVTTEITEVMLGPRVKNGNDLCPFLYSQLGKINKENKAFVSRSSIDYV